MEYYQDLKDEFILTASLFTTDQDLILSLWKELENAYNQSARHYHNMAHVATVWDRLKASRSEILDREALFFAALYHDAVYHALKSDNEEKSAALAQKRLRQIHFPESRTALCCQHILATKTHQNGGNNDTQTFIEADLAILAEEWPIYQAYTLQIRREYSIYPDLIYNAGRRKVLEKFLARDYIFRQDDLNALLESMARENMRKELDLLGK